MTDLVLGLDGGGTKTELALADRAGRVLLYRTGTGTGPVETPDWQRRLAKLVAETAPFQTRIAYAAFGMPSFGEIAAISARQIEAVAALSPYPHCVLNDVHAAYEGAFVGQPGVLLLAGTGSMVWAEDAAGQPMRVGGWGHGYGDEGGAFWIGRQAVAHLSHCLDGRAEDRDFVALMAAHLGLPTEATAEALAGWYYAGPDPRVRVAGLARAVDGFAEEGNAAARTILTEAAWHLARHVRAAWRYGPSLPAGRWSSAGSVLRSRTVSAHLARLLETAPVPAALPPIGGALWRAATNAGWAVGAAWIDRLRDQLLPQTRT